jgi:hypothetical protein
MSPEELRIELWRLPVSDRMAMLVLSCIEDDPGALGGVLNIVRKVVSAMGKRLAPHQRAVLAGNLRLTAARLERYPRQEIEVNFAKWRRASA